MISPIYLIIAGLILVLLELLIGIHTGFDLVLVGSSLLIGGVVGLKVDNFNMGLIISIVLSGLYIVFGRKLIKQKIFVLTHKTNTDNLAGQTGRVIKAITPDHPGQVRIGNEDWRATADEALDIDTKVKVISLEGVTLWVSKLSS